MKRKLLGEILVEKFSIDPLKISEALSIQKEKGGRIGEILCEMKYCTEEEVYRALSIQWDMKYREEIYIEEIEPPLIRTIPISYARKHLILPVRKKNGAIEVFISDPLNDEVLEDLKLIFKSDIVPILTIPAKLNAAINNAYEKLSEESVTVMEELNGVDLGIIAHEMEEPKDLLEADEEAPIIRFVNSLLYQAVRQRATDIHIEPYERQLVVRFRIDGLLYDIVSPPKRFHPSISSRIKIMAGLNIAEKRLPQDGRIRIKIASRDIDIRVSIIPTIHGERIVMRLLDKGQVILKLEELGMGPDTLGKVLKFISLSNGIILVTGPTGSGKTTTLYAALTRINTTEKNIITIEDPIEYQLTGIGQMQVNPKIDLTFAAGLRSILRQDPDVILVGEIRDRETAEIAIQASLTGHLVFSTLHTNDSAGAVTRLLDMGIEPYLVASSLRAVLAQRLVRILCNECKIPYRASPELLKELELSDEIPHDMETIIYRASGCKKCMNTGYWGRTGIYELLIVDEDIRNLIKRGVDSSTIRREAISKGMVGLRKDGGRKVLKGITSAEEVFRVTQEEAFL